MTPAGRELAVKPDTINYKVKIYNVNFVQNDIGMTPPATHGAVAGSLNQITGDPLCTGKNVGFWEVSALLGSIH